MELCYVAGEVEAAATAGVVSSDESPKRIIMIKKTIFFFGVHTISRGCFY